MKLPSFSNYFTRNLTISASILAGSTFLSAVLGLLRDRMLAFRFGAGPDLDIYAAAFRIPDLVYTFLITGGLAIAFLPLFSEYFSKDKKEGWQMANHVFNIFSVFLILFSFLLFLLSPWLVKILLPGFSFQIQKSALSLVRLLLLTPIFFGAANIFSGILQYFNKFFIYGLAPVVYNLSIILGIFFLSGRFGVFGVGLGVVSGAFLYFLIQFLGALRCGFSWKLDLASSFRQPALLKIIVLMVPRTIAVLLQQIKLWAVTAIASLIGAGAISIFYFANNLQGFFVNLVGVSFGTAVFPLLSRAASQKDGEGFSRSFKPAMRQIVFLAIVSTIFVFLFGNSLVNLVLRTGRFDETAAQTTSQLLFLFSFSFFAQAMIPLLLRAFFALQETKIPTLISFIALIAELAFLIVFLKLNLGVVSLAAAFSISSVLQFILLLYFLKKKQKQNF